MLGWDRKGHKYIAWKEPLQEVTGHGETTFTVLWTLAQLIQLLFFFFVCRHKAERIPSEEPPDSLATSDDPAQGSYCSYTEILMMVSALQVHRHS